MSPEKNTTSPASNPSSVPKLRSCVVCRARKVRCDKLSPCSNCRRANIACVVPSADRPPRWARRLDVASNAASHEVMERVRTLENLVKQLRGQLAEANAAVVRSATGGSAVNSSGGSMHDHQDLSHQKLEGDVHDQFGRLVLQDPDRSRYVSSGFWSRVNDEIDGLKIDNRPLGYDDYDTSEDESSPGKSPSTQELDRTPSDRHAFLFRHNISPSTPDLREFHPLPSQIPYFLDVFSENINSIIRIVHVPTVAKMIRDLRGKPTSSLTPSNEALMFAIYYAAITSMEDEEVTANFGVTKVDLNLKYRLGLEHALAKADFLNVPNIVLVQALAIFLCLGRRHDSPRSVWMMTGLAIRMAQALGLHRDGARFKHLTPYEIEMRRRAWWALCLIDVRASEDQGTDYTIAYGSFDTKLPLNINDADFAPETVEMPPAREGLTDMTLPLVSYETCNLTKEMMTRSVKDGASSMEEQGRLLGEIYEKLDRGYLQYSVESDNIGYWTAILITRLVMAKMTLLIYLPILSPAPGEQCSETTRAKLFVAAIEIAEYNHALNAEPACRHWRWVFQTYTHWYAIVFLLLEINRRSWSPLVERAWVALHSQWLIPAQSHMDKDLRIWVPLRKLMAKARKHRDVEIVRLRGDSQGADRLEIEDDELPIPASSGPFPDGSDVVRLFRERWRQLFTAVREPVDRMQIRDGSAENNRAPDKTNSAALSKSSSVAYGIPSGSESIPNFDSGYLGSSSLQDPHPTKNEYSFIPSVNPDLNPLNHSTILSDSVGIDNPNNTSFGPGFVPWSWNDASSFLDNLTSASDDALDVNMDLDGEMNWLDWLESTKGVE
ncbi:hypothetical protein P170DRAFT_448304 [Aspergillus steynii IBT 23096]|uniref:Zn(2)-C6 fungal-type domain-containing protein n=1 Tax=Aspergillus steynii IBT 23096 TaxID=1392250 RepID=A0A2I2G0J4_9EURO|nr:uncharacterized protein P170DRAFT_448304 [Aspergillus steynii IBT 23096]PLB46398.1 hypothetical protein P170DRAFT_448304 [Aspergillus steynii IBT 23096]